MTSTQIRSLFPALQTKVYGRDLLYLDNAATSQRPRSVVDCWEKLTLETNGNIHRAVHALASRATEAFENTRERVRAYLNAADTKEIIFTSGATAAINLVAFSFSEAFIGEGDEVIVSVSEHHSNLLPWQLACKRKKAVLKVLDIDEFGALEVESLQKLISERTKIIAIPHISNVLGLVNPVQEIITIAHKNGVPVLIDGAQGIVHCKVDVRHLDCDFYVFSGHKVYAATGTGVLYGKKEWLEKMPPFMSGGEMIDRVGLQESSFAPLPQKFEAGTQNFNAIPTLVPALELQESILGSAELVSEQRELLDYILEEFKKRPRIRLYGTGSAKVPLFSFSVEGAHHEDLALILDKMGVAVRSGQMCAEPLMDRLGVSGLVRASFAPYNTLDEAREFIKCLDRAVQML